MAFNFDSLYGSNLGTTRKFNEQRLRAANINSEQFKDIIAELGNAFNDILLQLNLKETGYYPLDEFLTNQQFFIDPSLDGYTSNTQTPEFRPVFRTTVNVGQLANTGSVTAAHNIDLTASVIGTRLYGVASNTAKTSFIPIPYVTNTLTEQIKLEVNGTNVVVTSYDDKTAYTNCVVVFEYMKF